MLTRAEFQKISDAIVEDFSASPPPPEAGRWAVRTTSGTSTGTPLVVVTKFDEFLMGARYGDVRRPVICYGSMSSRLTNMLHVRYAASEAPTQAIMLDYRDLTPALEPLFNDFTPDCFSGFNSFIVRAAAYLGAQQSALVASLKLTGERLTPSFSAFFADRFPRARIGSDYVATEIGALSKPPCGYLRPNTFHPCDDLEVRIDQPDDTGSGKILFTRRLYKELWARDYSTGDMGRLFHTPCPCGESVMLECAGREGSDFLKVAGALLLKDEFDRVAQTLRLFDDYRVEASAAIVEGQLKGRIVLRIFSSRGVGTQALANDIGARFATHLFVTPTQTLHDLIQAGVFMPLEVSWVEEPWPLKNKEVKLTQGS